jgi:hypothetical protein
MAGTKTYIATAGRNSVGKVNDTLQMVLTIAIVAVVGLIIWNIIKAAKAGSKLIGDAIGDQIVQQQTGIPVARQNQIRQLASDAHAAIYGEKGFFGYIQITEDEDAFIRAVNELRTTAEVKLFSQYYKNINGKSARADSNEYLDRSERARINNLVLQNLD